MFHRFPSRAESRFCSKSCARTALNLTAANPSFSRDITGERNPMFGKGLKGAANPMFGQRGPKAPRWTGGRKVRKDGYVMIWTDEGYVLEHRTIVEARLGRKLTAEEVVHHIDENPSNNAYENLALLPNQSEHVRVHSQNRQR